MQLISPDTLLSNIRSDVITHCHVMETIKRNIKFTNRIKLYTLQLVTIQDSL